jgi:hypothetical protein
MKILVAKDLRMCFLYRPRNRTLDGLLKFYMAHSRRPIFDNYRIFDETNATSRKSNLVLKGHRIQLGPCFIAKNLTCPINRLKLPL